MSLPHQSIATINSPEFINLQPLDINPFMSSCEIKVLYVGENRNRSFISKQTAMDMAKTLRGAPIVGYYKDSKEDFADHGRQMVFDDEGIHFNCLTRPYGFVAPNAKVWFQKFEEKDDFDNSIEREYLMTTGYLWTGQFQQAQSIIDQGKPQSMELDDDTLEGHWATNTKNNLEFFIINDAIFTKLCILGDDVEPCFEGASITKPQISSNFSRTLDNNFKYTLFTMINELKDALEGGNNMAKEEFTAEVENIEPGKESENTESTTESTFTEEQQPSELDSSDPVLEETEVQPSETFKKEEEEKEEKTSEEPEGSNDTDNKEEDEEDKDKYALLEQQYNLLTSQYQELKEEYEKLLQFKLDIEDKQKDALISEFYMLSEEDKKDILEHKTEYSLEEIKAKLAVICYQKKVNFNSDTSDKIDNKEKEKQDIVFTYTDSESSLPDWVKAVKSVEENI